MKNKNLKNSEKDYSGIFGTKMYLKAKKGKSELTIPKKRVAGELTPKQKAARKRFLSATKFGKRVMRNPELLAAYSPASKNSLNPYVLAVTNYLTPIEVDDVNVSGYTGAIGDKIIVEAEDLVAITGVTITIEDSTGALVERGDCVNDPEFDNWVYTVTEGVDSVTGFYITARVTNYPKKPQELRIAI